MIMLIKKLFCSHTYSDVDERGYQRCIKCNKSIYIGHPECNHIWKIHEAIEAKSWFSNIVHKIYVQQCTECGEMKNHSTKN
jgi:hypothetical protein